MTSIAISLGKVCRAMLLIFCIACCSSAEADKHGKSKNHHGGGGGQTTLSISPYGLGFSYQNRNFGISIGREGFGVAPVGPLLPLAEPVVPFPVPDSIPYGYPPPAPPSYSYPYGYHQNPGPGMPANPVPLNPRLEPPLPPGPGMPAPNGSDFAARNPSFSSTMIPTNQAARQFTTLAESEFRTEKYALARRHVDYALLQDNSNGHLLLFASHISMAMQDYERAALELAASTQRLHQNQWDFFVRDSQYWYPDQNYARQLNQLDGYCANQERDFGYALRGFQLACNGQTELAQRDFNRALQINPENQLVQRLQSRLQPPRQPRNQYWARPSVDNELAMPPADPGQNAPIDGEPAEVPPPPQDINPMKSDLDR